MHFDREDAKEFFQSIDIPVNKLMVLQGAKDISAMIQDIRVESKQQGKYHKEVLNAKIAVCFINSVIFICGN